MQEEKVEQYVSGPSGRSPAEGKWAFVFGNWDIIFAGAVLVLMLFYSLCFFLLGLNSDWAFQVLGKMLMLRWPFVIAAIALLCMLVKLVMSKPKKRRAFYFRLGLCVVLSIIAVFAYFEPFTFSVWGVRYSVAKSGGADQLQDWAVGILNRPKHEVLITDPDDKRYGDLKKSVLSSQVKELMFLYDVWIDNHGGERFIGIHTGGGGLVPNFGVLVGSPAFRVERENSPREVFRWQDGVYGYAD